MSTYILENNNIKAVVSDTGAAIEKLFFKGIEVGKDGIIVGRYANRIAGGSITIDGAEYSLSVNEGRNTLHGGSEGFSTKTWDIVSSEMDRAELKLISCDMDQGFPGTLTVSVTYTLTDNDELVIDYLAEADRPTVINLTNHLYFNLNAGGDASEHMLLIDAGQITETDDCLIPTGRFTDVKGTRYDYRTLRNFEPSYDDNYVLEKADIHIQAAGLYGTRTGIGMKVYTDQPGLQLYNTKTHICLETQHFADSPHRPEFPSTILRPGETFRSETIYAFE